MKNETKHKFSQMLLVLFAIALMAMAIYPALKLRGPEVLQEYFAVLGVIAFFVFIFFLAMSFLSYLKLPQDSKIWNIILILFAFLLLSFSIGSVALQQGPQVLVSFVAAYGGIIGIVVAFLAAGKLISLLRLPPRALLILIAVSIAAVSLGMVYGNQGTSALMEFAIGFSTLMVVAAVVILSFTFLSRMQSSPNGAIALVAGMILCVCLLYVVDRNEEGWGALDEFVRGMFFLILFTLFILSVFWLCDDAMNRGVAWWPFMIVFIITCGSYYFFGFLPLIPWVAVISLWLIIRPKQISSKDRWYQDQWG